MEVFFQRICTEYTELSVLSTYSLEEYFYSGLFSLELGILSEYTYISMKIEPNGSIPPANMYWVH